MESRSSYCKKTDKNKDSEDCGKRSPIATKVGPICRRSRKIEEESDVKAKGGWRERSPSWKRHQSRRWKGDEREATKAKMQQEKDEG